jgi:hypothetical protein
MAVAGAHAIPAQAQSLDPNYCRSDGRCSEHNVAVDFVRFHELLPDQARLLEHLRHRYEEWTQTRDSEAATFLAVSRSLQYMEVKVGQGKDDWVPFITFVTRITRFSGDRIFVKLDPVKFNDWRINYRGEFRIRKENGKLEDGRFRFVRGTSIGGSLHRGFDIQASTSVYDAPRIQINYRFSDAEADIDIDGKAPWKWGIIPNFKHLTYMNSDVRQWFEKFVRKFGDPGFRVRPH